MFSVMMLTCPKLPLAFLFFFFFLPPMAAACSVASKKNSRPAGISLWLSHHLQRPVGCDVSRCCGGSPVEMKFTAESPDTRNLTWRHCKMLMILNDVLIMSGCRLIFIQQTAFKTSLFSLTEFRSRCHVIASCIRKRQLHGSHPGFLLPW